MNPDEMSRTRLFIDAETAELLDAIAQSEDVSQILARIAPDPETFRRFLAEHELENDPIGESLLKKIAAAEAQRSLLSGLPGLYHFESHGEPNKIVSEFWREISGRNHPHTARGAGLTILFSNENDLSEAGEGSLTATELARVFAEIDPTARIEVLRATPDTDLRGRHVIVLNSSMTGISGIATPRPEGQGKVLGESHEYVSLLRLRSSTGDDRLFINGESSTGVRAAMEFLMTERGIQKISGSLPTSGGHLPTSFEAVLDITFEGPDQKLVELHTVQLVENRPDIS